MRAILVLLFSLLFILTNAQQRTARCVFTSFSVVSGTVLLTYDGTAKTTTFNVSVNTGSLLQDDNNALHIHQVGIDGNSVTCNDALKHYNPILNYGELTGVHGNITKNGVKVFTSSMVSLEGPYNVLGRAMVFHNSSNYRLGCCTIELTSDTLTLPAVGYNQSQLFVGTPHATYSLQNNGVQTTFNATVNSTHPFANGTLYVSHVHTLGLCDTGAYGSVLLTGLPTFNTSLSQTIAYEADLSKFAGRAFVTHNSADTNLILSCSLVVHKTYQNNVADNYVANTATAGSTGSTGATDTSVPTTGSSNTGTGTPAPSGSGVVLGFSVLALIANLF